MKKAEAKKAEAMQKRDIIVTQLINELGVTIETNTKPLIRCKDCTKCEFYAVDTGEDCMTGLWCGIHQKDTTPQAFCSYGERKGGDDE